MGKGRAVPGGPKRKGAPSKETGRQKKTKLQQQRQQFQDVPLPGEQPQDQAGSDDDPISDEDIEFVKEQGNSIGWLAKLDSKALDKSVHAAQKRDASKAAGATEAGAEKLDGDEEEPAQVARGGKDDDEGIEFYERVPRNQGAKDEKGGPKSRGLPVKSIDGTLQYVQGDEARGKGPRAQGLSLPRASQLVQVEGVTVEDELDTSIKKYEEEEALRLEQEATQEHMDRQRRDREDTEAAPPAALATLRALANREGHVGRAREFMATASTRLLAGPEESVGEFRTLLGMMNDPDLEVQRLAMVSLMAVCKDVAPGYRIRPPTQKELEVKVTKEVQKLRDYESALLKHYQAFLKGLLAAARMAPSPGKKAVLPPGMGAKQALAHARVSVRCMAQLLTTLMHFNYASDLLQAVVSHMASSDAQIRAHACGAVRELLVSTETTGQLALEAVQLVADLVRTCQCVCPPEVVQVLTALKFQDIRIRKGDDGPYKAPKVKFIKEKKPSKRARTEIDVEVDRDFKESDAGPNRRHAVMLQSQQLEALFEVYFRVIKHCTSSPLLQHDPMTPPVVTPAAGAAAATVAATAAAGALQQGQQGPPQPVPQKTGKGRRRGGKGGKAGASVAQDTGMIVGAVAPPSGMPRARLLSRHPLLYPALEGLGRYAHHISVEYFNDMMAVLHQLLRAPGLPLVERLRVLHTASDILKGQGEMLNVDRRELHARLYEALLRMPMRDVIPPAPGGPREEGPEDGATEAADPPATALLAAAAAGAIPGAVPGAVVEPGEAGQAAGRVEEPMAVLLGGILGQILCEPKIIDMSRLAAFVKRCCTMALVCPAPEALTLLGCTMRLLRRYPRLQSLLEWEGEAPIGSRTWRADCPDPSEAGALASCLWELPLLAAHHYHPNVQQAASSILSMAQPARGTGGVAAGAAAPLTGPLALPGTLKDLAAAYAHLARGGFRPGPAKPRAAPPAGRTVQGGKRFLGSCATPEGEDLLSQHGLSLAPPGGAAQEGEDQDSLQMGREGGEDIESQVAQSLQGQYRVARRHEVNQLLRSEKNRLVEQIKQFQLHMHSTTQQQAAKAQASAQQAGKPVKRARN